MTPMGSAPLAWGSSRGEGCSRSECRAAALPGCPAGSRDSRPQAGTPPSE